MDQTTKNWRLFFMILYGVAILITVVCGVLRVIGVQVGWEFIIAPLPVVFAIEFCVFVAMLIYVWRKDGFWLPFKR